MNTRIAIALVVGMVCAIISFAYWDNYPFLLTGRHDPKGALIFRYLVLHLISFAIPIAAFFRPTYPLAWIAATRAALFAALVIVLFLTSTHDVLDDFFIGFLAWVAVFDVIVLVVLGGMRYGPAAVGGLFWYPLLVAAMLGGWAAGVFVWSETVPRRIVAAAEAFSAGRPYCLVARNRPVSGRRDLTALAMLPTYSYGKAGALHALIVVEEAGRVGYGNWSYRGGKFFAIPDNDFPFTVPPRWTPCTPAANFAASLS